MYYTRVHAKYPTLEARTITQQQSQFQLACYYEYPISTNLKCFRC